MIAMIYAIESASPQTSSLPRGSALSSPILKYICVMHPEVVSDKPGKCPKCGMELVPKREPPRKQMHDTDAHPLRGMGAPSNPHESVRGKPDHGAMMKQPVVLFDPMSRCECGTCRV